MGSQNYFRWIFSHSNKEEIFSALELPGLDPRPAQLSANMTKAALGALHSSITIDGASLKFAHCQKETEFTQSAVFRNAQAWQNLLETGLHVTEQWKLQLELQSFVNLADPSPSAQYEKRNLNDVAQNSYAQKNCLVILELPARVLEEALPDLFVEELHVSSKMWLWLTKGNVQANLLFENPSSTYLLLQGRQRLFQYPKDLFSSASLYPVIIEDGESVIVL